MERQWRPPLGKTDDRKFWFAFGVCVETLLAKTWFEMKQLGEWMTLLGRVTWAHCCKTFLAGKCPIVKHYAFSLIVHWILRVDCFNIALFVNGGGGQNALVMLCIGIFMYRHFKIWHYTFWYFFGIIYFQALSSIFHAKCIKMSIH